MTQFAVTDPFFDGQTLRAAAAATFGGADIGECMAIARSVKESDLDDWYEQWDAAATRALQVGEAAAAAGQRATARSAFLRACTYARTAGVVFLSKPVDDRLPRSLARQQDAFRRAMPFLDHPVDAVSIPFEGGTLPGYHYRQADDGRRRATVILLNGYDGTVEETYFGNAQAALDRGYDVLAFDGPGQGTVLVDQDIPLRPDWENVLPPVVDWLLARGTADPDRIALIGWSLGGFLAPRAASGEPRLAACVADANFYDMFEMLLSRMPAALRDPLAQGDPKTIEAVGAGMAEMMKDPTNGWGMRRSLYVHGVDTMADFIQDSRRYTLAGYADKISCPTFVCRGESDEITASASQTVAALQCPHEFVTFTAATGAGDHCELGARQQYYDRAFGWLDNLLDPARVAD